MRASCHRVAAVVLCATAALTASAFAAAESMPVPVRVQAAILRKALAYDRVLHPKERIRFLVVGGRKADADEVAAAFRELGSDAAPVRAEELAGKLTDASVVYLLPGASAPAVRRACIERRVLSVTGVPEYAESGDASVAIGLRADGKPELVVNLRQVKAEGHEFSAEMLKLAKVVR